MVNTIQRLRQEQKHLALFIINGRIEINVRSIFQVTGNFMDLLVKSKKMAKKNT